MARARTAAKGGSSGGYGGAGSSGAGTILKFRVRVLNTYRGTSANAYGDESDVGTPYLTNVPAALAETSQQVFDAATQRNQIIRAITCRVDAWVDIITTDTLYEVTTGTWYMIESIEAEPGIGFYPPPKLLTLRERSGVSVTSD